MLGDSAIENGYQAQFQALSSAPKSRKAMMCLIEKIQLILELHGLNLHDDLNNNNNNMWI